MFFITLLIENRCFTGVHQSSPEFTGVPRSPPDFFSGLKQNHFKYLKKSKKQKLPKKNEFIQIPCNSSEIIEILENLFDLKKFQGIPGISWNSPKCPGLPSNCQNSPEFTGIHRNSPEFTGIHRSSPEFTGVHRNSPEFTGIHRNSPEFPGVPPGSPWVPLGPCLP